MINPHHHVVLIILDSNHIKQRMLVELEANHETISADYCIVAADSITQGPYDILRSNAGWINGNPMEAAIEVAQNHQDFVIEQPPRVFNVSGLDKILLNGLEHT